MRGHNQAMLTANFILISAVQLKLKHWGFKDRKVCLHLIKWNKEWTLFYDSNKWFFLCFKADFTRQSWLLRFQIHVKMASASRAVIWSWQLQWGAWCNGVFQDSCREESSPAWASHPPHAWEITTRSICISSISAVRESPHLPHDSCTAFFRAHSSRVCYVRRRAEFVAANLRSEE